MLLKAVLHKPFARCPDLQQTRIQYETFKRGLQSCFPFRIASYRKHNRQYTLAQILSYITIVHPCNDLDRDWTNIALHKETYGRSKHATILGAGKSFLYVC